jgi:alkanesulfonate monooxygenase SsuD/methylene tetrahydromethanopterin reductase-like flavin-dependent oxidoreductase (luciferase family)
MSPGTNGPRPTKRSTRNPSDGPGGERGIMPRVQHALYLPPFGTFGDVNLLLDLAGEAEQAGWDGFFMWDHLLFEIDVPFVDAWLALAAIAVVTERIRIGPLVTPIPRRRPWKVAREAVTLDHLSGGRLVLGVGLGIDFWREFGAFRGEASTDVERAELLDDGIEILRRLWSGESVSYAGARSSVEAVRFLPRPFQQPRIPIWSAALAPLRPGPTRRAARCDGVMPFGPERPLTPDDVRSIVAAILARRASQEPFDVCVHGPRELAADFAAAGVTWYCESFGPDQPLADVRQRIANGPPEL